MLRSSLSSKYRSQNDTLYTIARSSSPDVKIMQKYFRDIEINHIKHSSIDFGLKFLNYQPNLCGLVQFLRLSFMDTFKVK